MISVVAYKIAVIVLVASLLGASGTAVYYHDQQGTQISKAADLNTQIGSLQSQIDTLNSQINKLNAQISQLQTLNNQLGGNNSQLISQIKQLGDQLSQYQYQVSQLEAQVASLNKIIGLQSSRVIANTVCIFSDCPTGNGGTIVGNHAFIDLLPTRHIQRHILVLGYSISLRMSSLSVETGICSPVLFERIPFGVHFSFELEAFRVVALLCQDRVLLQI